MRTRTSSTAASAPQRHLTLLDCTSIIVGIIIGAGIYETTPLIAQNVSGPMMLLSAFALGGAISLIGALCYAELATAWPREGGDYVFITQAYGRRMGFLLAWSWFWVVRPGSIGAMAFIFARYASELRPLGIGGHDPLVYAAGSVIVLSALNVAGLRGGARTQNVLTAAKVLGLLTVLLMGLTAEPPSPAESAIEDPQRQPDFALAMIFVLFTYGGWNDISYVAAEVRNPHRNLLRSLVLGVMAVTAIYVLANIAFVRAVGFEGVAQAQALAARVVTRGAGTGGSAFISALICISALGAINGMLLTGGRVYYAVGRDHRLFAWLGRWDPRLDAPLRSLAVQALVTVGLITAIGSEQGLERMVAFTAPVFWFFLLLVALSVFILRRRLPDAPRPYRVPLYPLTPLLFAATCLFMLHASLTYAVAQRHAEAMWTLGALAIGCAICLLGQRRGLDTGDR